MHKSNINNAQNPSRQTAIHILESIAERIGNEDIFDCKNGDTLWYDLEDMITNILLNIIKPERNKITQRNRQIKRLKEKIENLLDTPMNAYGETLRVILNR